MLDSRKKRAAVIGVARAWYRNPHPSGMDATQRASVAQAYPVAPFTQPVPAFTGTIDDISVLYDSGSYIYDFTTYYTYATSYAISPDSETEWALSGSALERTAIPGLGLPGLMIPGKNKTGWSFSAGVLTINAHVLGNFGPFTVTGINSSGQTDSNRFTIEVAVATPTPSGVSRPNTSKNKNRSHAAKGTNRVIAFVSKNRK